MFKIDIENKIPINDYEFSVSTLNLDNDNYIFKLIKEEQLEYLSNISDYKHTSNDQEKNNLQNTLNKNKENLIQTNKKEKVELETKINNDKEILNKTFTEKNKLNKEISNLDGILVQEKNKLDDKLKEELIKLDNMFKEKIEKLEKEKLDNEKAVNKKIKTKQKTLNELIARLESKFYSTIVKNYTNPIKKSLLLNDPDVSLKSKFIENKFQTFNYKFNYTAIMQLIEIFRKNFQTLEKTDLLFDEYNISQKNHNYIVDAKENQQIPYLKLELIKNKTIADNKLKIKLYDPKLCLIQPIFCDCIYNNVSNNNVLSYINIKNKYLSESINEIENITYFKVTQTNINRIKIYFSEELKKVLDFLNIRYFITLHLKPL